MNGNSGFVVIQRSLYEHPAFRDLNEAGCFAWMITQAAWKPTRVRYKDRIIYLKRGELALSVRDLANAFGRPQTWAYRFLERLKSETMIGTGSGTGVNVISICNYGKYQDKPDKAETPVETPVGTPPEHHRNTEQTIEQENKKKEFPPIIPLAGDDDGKRKYLPKDWKPPPISDLTPKAKECAEQWPRGVYAREAEGFVLYWQSERKMKTDWKKTWAVRIITRHPAIMRDAAFDQRRRSGGSDETKLYQVLNESR